MKGGGGKSNPSERLRRSSTRSVAERGNTTAPRKRNLPAPGKHQGTRTRTRGGREQAREGKQEGKSKKTCPGQPAVIKKKLKPLNPCSSRGPANPEMNETKNISFLSPSSPAREEKKKKPFPFPGLRLSFSGWPPFFFSYSLGFPFPFPLFFPPWPPRTLYY